ncbi:hypothetical protein SOVF_122940 isoform A, partial [Spinacia oleracea]
MWIKLMFLDTYFFGLSLMSICPRYLYDILTKASVVKKRIP